MKLAIIIGTRPEIIRLSATINKAKQYFDVILIHTGQNYDYNLNDIFFDEFKLQKPDYYLNVSKDNLGNAVGDVISKSYNLLNEIKPDAILILGDTNSCLCAYSAKRLKIPIFHMEAGNRCFDINVPEEINRKIIDGLADINLTYTEHARRNLLNEGLKPEYIFVLGSPMYEILNNFSDKIDNSNILRTMNILPKEYIILSTHREENINNKTNFNIIVDTINTLANKFNNFKIIFSVHPRTRKQLVENKIILPNNVILSEPFGFIDYCKLQKYAYCVLSDSGTLTEEATILEFPAVLFRTSTERPEGIDNGSIILGSLNSKDIIRNISLAISNKIINNINEYKINNVSDKVCNIISGYTDIVNKNIWRKLQ